VLSLVEILEVEKTEFNENEIIGKVHELAQFRNVLFTERYENKEMIFRKTGFSNYPLHANLNDVFETMYIVLEVTGKLDNAHAGIKTMPEILLSNSEIALRKPFDICFREILRPCFKMAAEKTGTKPTMYCLNQINDFLEEHRNSQLLTA
jgi:hypothetical protein